MWDNTHPRFCISDGKVVRLDAKGAAPGLKNGMGCLIFTPGASEPLN